MNEATNVLVEALINAAISGLLVSLVLGYFITTRDEKIKSNIQEEFKKRDTYFSAQFDFKRRSIEELLGPVVMQLRRSSITLNAYDANNFYREAILKECNEKIRDILLTRSFLIPSELVPDAIDLIKHYDEWLQTYQFLRLTQNDMKSPFVFTYNFPQKAELNFNATYDTFRKELKIETVLN